MLSFIHFLSNYNTLLCTFVIKSFLPKYIQLQGGGYLTKFNTGRLCPIFDRKDTPFIYLRVRQKFSYPLVCRTSTILNLVVQNPRFLSKKFCSKLKNNWAYILYPVKTSVSCRGMTFFRTKRPLRRWAMRKGYIFYCFLSHN